MLAGLGPGLLATALSAALAAVWILPAERQFGPMTMRQAVSLTAFAAMGLLLSLVASFYRNSRHRVARYERDLALRESEDRFRKREEEGRRRAEGALRASEAQLQTTLENLSEGVAVSALDGRLLHFNRAALDLHGFSTLEECRLHLAEFALTFELSDLGGTVLPLSEWPLARVLRGESVRDLEVRVWHRRRGWQRVYSYGGNLVRDADGQPLMAVITLSDVTERKRAEEELKEKNDELVRFTYTVSHDLKSPLVTVRTFLGYLEEDIQKQDEAGVRQDFDHIRTAADRMSRLLDELLDLSRVGRKMNPPVQVPLQTVVKEALDLVAGRLAQGGVKVEVTEAPVLLHGDRPRLVEVFQNLVDNAAKFMGDQPAPRIEVGVDAGGGEPVLFVRDNGIGIDPRHQKKLFGLFEKLDPGTEGTGIGLAQVRRIVQVHGGKIWAESAGRGHGACFRFTLAKTSRESRLQDTA